MFEQQEFPIVELKSECRVDDSVLLGLPRPQITTYLRDRMGSTAYGISCRVAGTRQEPVVVSHPDGWREWLKLDFLSWASKKRWLRRCLPALQKRLSPRIRRHTIDWHVLHPWVDVKNARDGRVRVADVSAAKVDTWRLDAGIDAVSPWGAVEPMVAGSPVVGTPLGKEPDWDGEKIYKLLLERRREFLRDRVAEPKEVVLTEKQRDALAWFLNSRPGAFSHQGGFRPVVPDFVHGMRLKVANWDSQVARNPPGYAITLL